MFAGKACKELNRKDAFIQDAANSIGGSEHASCKRGALLQQ